MVKKKSSRISLLRNPSLKLALTSELAYSLKIFYAEII